MIKAERELRDWIKLVAPERYRECNKFVFRMRKAIVEECALVVEESIGEEDTGSHPIADIIRVMMGNRSVPSPSFIDHPADSEIPL